MTRWHDGMAAHPLASVRRGVYTGGPGTAPDLAVVAAWIINSFR
jgi:hypothetical protein